MGQSAEGAEHLSLSAEQSIRFRRVPAELLFGVPRAVLCLAGALPGVLSRAMIFLGQRRREPCVLHHCAQSGECGLHRFACKRVVIECRPVDPTGSTEPEWPATGR